MRQLKCFPKSRSNRITLLRASCPFVALAGFLLASASVSAGPNVPDPVADLREALRPDPAIPIGQAAINFRKENLKKKIEALRTIGDLGRAMLLQDWRETEGDARGGH